MYLFPFFDARICILYFISRWEGVYNIIKGLLLSVEMYYQFDIYFFIEKKYIKNLKTKQIEQARNIFPFPMR